MRKPLGGRHSTRPVCVSTDCLFRTVKWIICDIYLSQHTAIHYTGYTNTHTKNAIVRFAPGIILLVDNIINENILRPANSERIQKSVWVVFRTCGDVAPASKAAWHLPSWLMRLMWNRTKEQRAPPTATHYRRYTTDTTNDHGKYITISYSIATTIVNYNWLNL